MAGELGLLPSATGVPDANRLVETGTGQGPAVRSKGDGIDPVRVPLQRPPLLAGRRIPKLDRFIRTAGCQDLTIRRKDEAGHGVAMSRERVPHLKLGQRADHNSLVFMSRGKELTVRRVGQG